MAVREKHALWLRIVHWLNVPFLSLMVWSGLLIYWANDEYPGFFPEAFYKALHLDHHLALGIAVHFFVAWFFVFNALIYLLGLFLSRHSQELLPNRQTAKDLLPTVLHDLGLRPSAPIHGKFNAAQRFAYTSVIVLGFLAITSGFAVYKPVQLGWLAACFGGYRGARLVHFIVMLLFCAFVLVHIAQVIRAGWNNFRAMVSGFEAEE